MQFMRLNMVRSCADVISDILNCVCPECGGRMGEPGKEFKCRGECLRDWRQTWKRAFPVRSTRSKTATSGI
jgi:tRNA(Ile2) C34 agmatinyltransferase TiaS